MGTISVKMKIHLKVIIVNSIKFQGTLSSVQGKSTMTQLLTGIKIDGAKGPFRVPVISSADVLQMLLQLIHMIQHMRKNASITE